MPLLTDRQASYVSEVHENHRLGKKLSFEYDSMGSEQQLKKGKMNE